MTTAVADEIELNTRTAQDNLAEVISQLPIQARIALSDFYYGEWQNALFAMSH